MRGWILLLVFLIWLRLTLGLIERSTEGFDPNFKRVIPIHIDGDTLTLPPKLGNALNSPDIQFKHLSPDNLEVPTSLHNLLQATSLIVGAKMTGPGDTLVVDGNLTAHSVFAKDLTVQGTIRMKDGWTIHTNNDLYIGGVKGSQITSDGNIRTGTYDKGFAELVRIVGDDRASKIEKERNRIREREYQAQLQRRREEERRRREAEEKKRRDENVLQQAGRAVGSFFRGLSDRRLKTQILDMAPMLDRILTLAPKEYNWIDRPGKGFGFIAQEVHALFPEMPKVYPGEQGDDSENPVDAQGNPIYYGLDYGSFTPYLVKAIQEMKQQHDQQVQSLESRIEQLEKYLNRDGIHPKAMLDPTYESGLKSQLETLTVPQA